MPDQRLRKLAKVLVHYSTRVKPGEYVVVQAEEVASEWIDAVSAEAIRAGAHVEVLLDLPSVKESLLTFGTEEQLLQGRRIQKFVAANADVWLTAWGTRNTRSNANRDPKKLQLAARGAASWRKIYSRRMGSGALRWCGTQFPTHADAQEADMSLTEYQDFVYDAGLLNAPDPVGKWNRIREKQQGWVDFLNGKKQLHILSEGTDLTVNVADRTWLNCCGEVNFPDGEVFTSPVEDGINGRISFDFLGIYMGKMIERISLEIEAGRVVKAAAEKGEDLLRMLLETDKGSRYFGEVAVGTNERIRRFTRNMLFDEKIGGTVHMAIGDSMPEAGGRNRSTIHWDMLCDMRKGGKITADGELIYENGRFIF